MSFHGRVAVAVIGIGLALSLAAQSEIFKARLSAVAADAKTRPSLAGSGSVKAVLMGTKLTITGSFEGLPSAATSASLNATVAAGLRGPAIGDVTIAKATSGNISRSFELTPRQLTSLHKGGLYIQIHSEKAPAGVSWG